MPLYNIVTENSKIVQALTYNNQVIPCKLYSTSTPTADADGWYIKPGTIVKIVGDYTVAPAEATDVAFGIVEEGLNIASHAVGTPLAGAQIGVIPFVYGQAIIKVAASEAVAVGDVVKFVGQEIAKIVTEGTPDAATKFAGIVVKAAAEDEIAEVIV